MIEAAMMIIVILFLPIIFIIIYLALPHVVDENGMRTVDWPLIGSFLQNDMPWGYVLSGAFAIIVLATIFFYREEILDWVMGIRFRKREDGVPTLDPSQTVVVPDQKESALSSLKRYVFRCKGKSDDEQHKHLVSSLTNLIDNAQKCLIFKEEIDHNDDARKVFTIHLGKIVDTLELYLFILEKDDAKATKLAEDTSKVAEMVSNTLYTFLDSMTEGYVHLAENHLDVVRRMTKDS